MLWVNGESDTDKLTMLIREEGVDSEQGHGVLLDS